ncbi:MAG: carboxymuconolactone decarboxylase family protein [Polyangiaceae bacterium]|nr:carboxymuconolactone decarboxylase family protein [Polyangiaceae bacterium]
MQARMRNPAMIVPDAMKAIQGLQAATHKAGVPEMTMHLVHLRASQINGCGVCVEGGSHYAKKAGETDQRLFSVAAWRDAPFFTDAERAALALAESITRLADRSDPVPDDVWNEAAKHYEERQLAALVLWIGVSNLFNRVNAATKQVAGVRWDG